MPQNKTILIYVQDYLVKDDSSSQFQEELNMPLGILYLGSYLNSHGYKTRLIDTRLYRRDDFFKVLQRELNDSLSVGFSVMTPCIGNALEITKFAKEVDPAIKTIWGGIHASLFPESTALSEYVDFVIVNEGERPLLNLVEYLWGREIRISDIPNLVFAENGNIVKNKIESEDNLESIGLPNYELLEMHRYIDRAIRLGYRRRQAEVIASRGCPHRCTFCVNTTLYGNRWRSEPVEQTVKNLDYLINVYNAEHIFFMDEDLFCSRKRIEALIDKITKRNITWEGNCRADYISPTYIDEAFLCLLKKSGCVKLRLGLESGSQRILDSLKKEISTSHSVDAIRRLTEHKILPSASFMMGMPGESEEDVIKTLDLILKLFTINPKIDIIGPLVFRPYPGSELFKQCQEKGLDVPESLDEWSEFYIHNNLGEYKKGLPWFSHVYMFKRVSLFIAHLKAGAKIGIPIFLIRWILKFHLWTKLRFIAIDYSIYKFLRRFIKKLRGSAG